MGVSLLHSASDYSSSGPGEVDLYTPVRSVTVATVTATGGLAATQRTV
jgi:hypothetical protein